MATAILEKGEYLTLEELEKGLQILIMWEVTSGKAVRNKINENKI